LSKEYHSADDRNDGAEIAAGAVLKRFFIDIRRRGRRQEV
jgi:hypothetical protein